MDYNEYTRTLHSNSASYYLNQIEPEQMYKWVKTGLVNSRAFAAWARVYNTPDMNPVPRELGRSSYC